MCAYISFLERCLYLVPSDQHDIFYADAFAGYGKGIFIIRQFTDSVPVGIVDHMGVAVAGDTAPMMPACKWNADAVAAIAASLRPLRADRTFMCVGF